MLKLSLFGEARRLPSPKDFGGGFLFHLIFKVQASPFGGAFLLSQSIHQPTGLSRFKASKCVPAHLRALLFCFDAPGSTER
jgi:hypothetical protein